MKNIQALSTNKKVLLLLSLFVVALVYFLSSYGRNNSNDGSHTALAKALYYDHDVRIEKYFHHVKCCDYAEKDGKLYSDRLPGNALLMQAFLGYNGLLKLVGLDGPSSRYEPDIVALALLPVLCGTLTVLLIFSLFLKMGFPYLLSLVSALVYASCTTHWVESSHTYSHAPSALFVFAAVYLAIPVKNIPGEKLRIFSCAALLGFSVMIELQNVLFAGPLFFYLAFQSSVRKGTPRQWLPVLVLSGAIMACFTGLLLLYNHIAFGEWLLKSNTYNPNFPEEKTFMTSLAGDFRGGLDKLLTSFHDFEVYYNWRKGIHNDTPGVFVASPVLLVSLIGFIPFYRRYPAMALMFIQFIVISILIAAFHKTTLTRHIFTIMPFFFFPFIFVAGRRSLSKAALFAIGSITFLSFLRTSALTVFQWSPQEPRIFPFRTEIGYFILFFVPLFLSGFWWLVSERRADDTVEQVGPAQNAHG